MRLVIRSAMIMMRLASKSILWWMKLENSVAALALGKPEADGVAIRSLLSGMNSSIPSSAIFPVFISVRLEGRRSFMSGLPAMAEDVFSNQQVLFLLRVGWIGYPFYDKSCLCF